MFLKTFYFLARVVVVKRGFTCLVTQLCENLKRHKSITYSKNLTMSGKIRLQQQVSRCGKTRKSLTNILKYLVCSQRTAANMLGRKQSKEYLSVVGQTVSYTQMVSEKSLPRILVVSYIVEQIPFPFSFMTILRIVKS